MGASKTEITTAKDQAETAAYAEAAANVIRNAKAAATRSVNLAMTYAYFEIGRIVVEEEQSGGERAEYGKQVIANVSIRLSSEFGRGFTFVGRQQRFTCEEDHFKVDLVFYNRLLRCFVLFDLKLGKLTHQDIGQMQMYMHYYDRNVKMDDENPTIGILLCQDKNDAMVKMTLPEDDEQIFASRYKTVLPSVDELKGLLAEVSDDE